MATIFSPVTGTKQVVAAATPPSVPDLDLVFPNFQQTGLTIKAGGTMQITVPETDPIINTLRPGNDEHDSGAIFNGWVEWTVDGTEQTPIQFASPRPAGNQGGYDNTQFVPVSITVPSGAKDIRFWFHTQNTNIAREEPGETNLYYPDDPNGQGINYDVKVQQ